MFSNPKGSFVQCHAMQICSWFKSYSVIGKEDGSKGGGTGEMA